MFRVANQLFERFIVIKKSVNTLKKTQLKVRVDKNANNATFEDGNNVPNIKVSVLQRMNERTD